MISTFYFIIPCFLFLLNMFLLPHLLFQMLITNFNRNLLIFLFLIGQ